MAAVAWRQWFGNGLLLMLSLLWVGSVVLAIEYGTRHSWLFWIEHWTGDWRTMLFSDRPKGQHSKIAVVNVTEETLQAYPYRTPIDRDLVARLVTTIDEAGAEAIAIDYLFLKATEPDKDEKLVQAIRAASARVVLAVGDKRVELTEAQRAYQSEFLQRTGAEPGFANLLTGRDRIVRFIAPPVDKTVPKSLAVAAAKPAAVVADGPRRISWLLRPKDGNQRFFTVPAHLLAGPPDAAQPVAAAALANFLKNKVVFVGADLVGLDRHLTPLPSWENDDEMPGVMIHAQVAAQLVDGRSITRVDAQALRIIFAMLAVIGFWIGLRHGTFGYSLYFGSTTLALAAIDVGLFIGIRQFLPFGACLAALIAGLIGGIAVRRLVAWVAIILRPT
ncbi:MAG: CHASE2 domain-containing protein [Hyphomicrobiaceae bacterium]